VYDVFHRDAPDMNESRTARYSQEESQVRKLPDGQRTPLLLGGPVSHNESKNCVPEKDHGCEQCFCLPITGPCKRAKTGAFGADTKSWKNHCNKPSGQRKITSNKKDILHFLIESHRVRLSQPLSRPTQGGHPPTHPRQDRRGAVARSA